MNNLSSQTTNWNICWWQLSQMGKLVLSM
jgi:hypothetical protein